MTITETQQTPFSLNVLIASHNRSKLTFSSIERLILYSPSNLDMQIYLIDDGSTDDTVFRIRNAYPNVKIIEGDGFWYWAKSMSVGDVFSSSDLRNVLWLNDDVRICQDSLSRSIELSNANPGSIIVGQCFSKESGALTYGGLSKHPWHPFKFSLIFFQ